MPKGGFRPGAGRVKGGKTIIRGPRPVYLRVPHDIAQAAKGSGMGPDEYLWTLMNDESQDISYRFRAAAVLMPFHCPRAADARVGKKEVRASAARQAGRGSEWGSDLDFDNGGGN